MDMEKNEQEYMIKAKKNGEIIGADTLYLFEWQEYMIVGKKEFSVRIGDEKIKAEKINENTYIATFQFKNYVGKSFIEILENDIPKKPVEVLSKKVLEIMGVSGSDAQTIKSILDAHDRFYRALLEDLLEISSSLPFSISSPTGFVSEESDKPVNELFAYHYFRNNKQRIREAFETVLRKAKRKLVEEYEWLELHEADGISPETLLSIVQHSEYLAPAKTDILVAKQLKGYAPTKILSYLKYESFDTPENRFAKYFLDTLIVWAERVIESLDNKNDKIDLQSIKEVLNDLEFIRENTIWDEVGEMTLFPYTSQALLKGDGYRDLLELYREFTAYVPFFDELWKAIENKDIATLYEYWAFFRLVKELSAILGEPKFHVEVKVSGILSEGSYVSLGRGWKLYYNRKFLSKSYSVPVKPDFALLKDKTVIGVFDAKFKVAIPPIEKFADMDKDMERTPDLQTWAKLEDIYKMHTYRDALRAKFAVVIYPGKESVFFRVDHKKEKPWALEDLISDEDVKMEGVGYLSFVPEVKE